MDEEKILNERIIELQQIINHLVSKHEMNHLNNIYISDAELESFNLIIDDLFESKEELSKIEISKIIEGPKKKKQKFVK